MFIKKYDMCEKQFSNYYSLKRFPKFDNFYYITRFFQSESGRIENFGLNYYLETLNTLGSETFCTEDVNINIDQQTNLIYVSQGYYDYKNKPTTPDIDRLLEEENFIELCKMGFLDYITMTKENFMHILLTWNKILDQLPPFVLLYQDDQDWYEILSFDSKEAMEKFVTDHTK